MAKGNTKEDELQRQTLESAFHRWDKFYKDSLKAPKITDKQSQIHYSGRPTTWFVENVGFCRLMEHLEPWYSLADRKYISKTALPKVYDLM